MNDTATIEPSAAAQTVWTIDTPQVTVQGGCHRVSTVVGGRPVWFESCDVPLTPSLEAFAGAFLIPAMHRGATLALSGPVDAVWLEHMRRLSPIFAQWWKLAPDCPITARETGQADRPAAEGVACCFTGGVDSFHTLLRRSQQITHLLYVHGYDIPIADRVRMEAYEPSLREVARLMGKRVILLRTNLCEHPLFNRVSWDRTHGAGLAAAAHLAGRAIGRLIVPSSYTLGTLRPWGTHPHTDPLWSGSSVVIEHDDATTFRIHKLGMIGRDPIVQRHLRVCWEKRAATGNCSRCEKCLRTMVGLEIHGCFASCTTFDHSRPLPELLRSAPLINPHLLVAWHNLMRVPMDSSLRDGIRHLILRSTPGRWRRMRQRWAWRVGDLRRRFARSASKR